MAYIDHKLVLPGHSASGIGQYLAVRLNPGVNDEYILAASSLDDVFGLTIATSASAGSDCAVVVSGVAKALAMASLGAGGIVGVGSPNGQLGPVNASGVASSLGNVQLPRWAVGRALENAVAGQIFAVLIKPGEIF